MGKVFIIDDDEGTCRILCKMTVRLGHECQYSCHRDEGLSEVEKGRFDLVLLDVRMPEGSGLDILPKIKAFPSAPDVIIITGFGEPAGAELALTSGAWDYIHKPISLQNFELQLNRVFKYREERDSARRPRLLKRDNLIGRCRRFQVCLDQLAEAASSMAGVLVTGETGTGKELFARAIHENSPRVDNNFVVVDCTALPENLVESLLFGHEKGAFTGADRYRQGMIGQADGGTLFLDEIGELPMVVQKSFLRVLQERRFRPLGSEKELESDFRLIAATNRNLNQLIEEGLFREDLLYRMSTFTIKLPPLRERRKDIKLLVEYWLDKMDRKYGIGSKGLSPDFMELLTHFDWPGNVRELFNITERAVAAAGSTPILIPQHLPTQLRVQMMKNVYGPKPDDPAIPEGLAAPFIGGYPINSELTLKETRELALAEVEKQYLADLMVKTNRNIKLTCDISGLSRTRLYVLLKKHGLTGGGDNV